jgi:hypothetical protein
METQKVLIKIAYCLVGLSVIVLIGLTIFQHQQIKELSDNVDTETVAKDESAGEAIPGPVETTQNNDTQRTAVAGLEKEAYKNEVDELEYQLDAAEEELDMAQEQLSDELTRKEELKKMELELQKKYRENPSYRKSMKNSLDRQYGDFFEKLNLSPEKLDEFKDLLVDQQMESSDFYTEMQNVTPSEEKRAEFEQRSKELNENREAEIKEFLGDSNYEKYQEYQGTWYLKYQVDNFMATLESGEELTDTQQQELIEAMKEEIKNISSERSDEDNKFLFPSEMYDEERMERTMEYQDRRNEAYLNAAENILSSSQTAKYKEYLKQQRDMMESSMKLQALRYGD